MNLLNYQANSSEMLNTIFLLIKLFGNRKNLKCTKISNQSRYYYRKVNENHKLNDKESLRNVLLSNSLG